MLGKQGIGLGNAEYWGRMGIGKRRQDIAGVGYEGDMVLKTYWCQKVQGGVMWQDGVGDKDWDGRYGDSMVLGVLGQDAAGDTRVGC